MAKLSGETVEAMLAAQGIGLAPGRGEKLAAAVEPLLSARSRLPEPADFDTDPTAYLRHFQE